MIDRVNLATESQEEQHREQIAALFPNCVEEGGTVDLKRLAVELGQNPMLVEREREREVSVYMA